MVSDSYEKLHWYFGFLFTCTRFFIKDELKKQQILCNLLGKQIMISNKMNEKNIDFYSSKIIVLANFSASTLDERKLLLNRIISIITRHKLNMKIYS